MKVIIISLAILLVVIEVTSFKPNSNLDRRWERFKTEFKKKYVDLAEELTRREIWEKNIAFIDKHNEEYKEGKHSYALAENRFADMTEEEKKKFMGRRTDDLDGLDGK